MASYYNAVLPHLRREDLEISILEIGSTHASVPLIHPVIDQLRFIFRIITQRPDLVHLNPSFNAKSFLRAGLFILAAKLLCIPALVFFRGWRKSFEKTVEKKLRWFFRLTYCRADACIVLSQTFSSWLRGMGMKCGVFTETTVVDDNLLAETQFLRAKIYGKNGEFRILFLGSVLAEKGIFELLEALRMVRGRNKHVTLTIAGVGRDFDRVKRWIADHGLAGAVFPVGHVHGGEKTKLLDGHDLFCLPSWDEGLPNALLEAMAFGMPVIVTPVGGIPDFFVEEEMGYLVPAKDPAVLAGRIEKLVNDSEAFKRMSARNREYALNKFLASKAAGRLAGIYSSLTYSAKTQA